MMSSEEGLFPASHDDLRRARSDFESSQHPISSASEKIDSIIAMRLILVSIDSYDKCSKCPFKMAEEYVQGI